MGVSIQGGKGHRKSLNADLNLVHYIDLLTCMVAFLLITAEWPAGRGGASDDE